MISAQNRKITSTLLNPANQKSINVVELVFSNSKTRNAFSTKDAEDLLAILEDQDFIKFADVLVFKSQGPGPFCSGGDLSEHLQPKQARQYSRRILKALKTLHDLKIPTLAVVEGDCFGGGLELLSCFDLVIATPNVLFGFWQRRMGLSFGWGGFARLKTMMATRKLQSLALSTEVFSVQKAVEFGLVHTICPSSGVKAVLDLKCRELGSRPKLAATVLKGLFRAELKKDRADIDFAKLWKKAEHLLALKR